MHLLACKQADQASSQRKGKIIDTKAFSPWPAPASMPERRSNPMQAKENFAKISNLSPAHHPNMRRKKNQGNLEAECSLWVECRGIMVSNEGTFKTRFRKRPAANAILARRSMHKD